MALKASDMVKKGGKTAGKHKGGKFNIVDWIGNRRQNTGKGKKAAKAKKSHQEEDDDEE